jgi:hypothetical protein
MATKFNETDYQARMRLAKELDEAVEQFAKDKEVMEERIFQKDRRIVELQARLAFHCDAEKNTHFYRQCEGHETPFCMCGATANPMYEPDWIETYFGRRKVRDV